jgi:hypothetical protein
MFLPKEKYTKLLRKTITIISDISKQNNLKNTLIFNNFKKNFSILNKNKKQNTTINSNKYKFAYNCSSLLKNFKRNFCILEKINEEDNISKEEFIAFVTDFKNGEISMSEFPIKYKKFIKEIKLLPREPEEPDECCGKDCVPCIIEFYHEKLDRRNEMVDDLYKKIYPDNDKEESSDVEKSHA